VTTILTQGAGGSTFGATELVQVRRTATDDEDMHAAGDHAQTDRDQLVHRGIGWHILVVVQNHHPTGRFPAGGPAGCSEALELVEINPRKDFC
jgi:hypothetical protein